MSITTRKVKDAIDLETNEKVYLRGHAKSTFMSDGLSVEDAISSINITAVDTDEEVEDLEDGEYATKGYVDNAISNIEIPSEVLEGFIPLSRDFSDDFNNDFAR